MSDLKPIIEALIYASPEPVTIKALCKLLDTEPKEDVAAALEGLKADYQRPGGLQVVEVAGGYQIVTRPELHEWVRRLFHERTTQKLSVAALETLAVIAYKQPVTAPEIADVRGVNTAGVLGTLVDRKLVKVVGRKAIVGRPFMYGTTRDFLERFGLNDLTDLPKVEDMSDLLGFDLPSGLGEPAPQSALPFDAGIEPALGSGDAQMPHDDEPRADDAGEPVLEILVEEIVIEEPAMDEAETAEGRDATSGIPALDDAAVDDDSSTDKPEPIH